MADADESSRQEEREALAAIFDDTDEVIIGEGYASFSTECFFQSVTLRADELDEDGDEVLFELVPRERFLHFHFVIGEDYPSGSSPQLHSVTPTWLPGCIEMLVREKLAEVAEMHRGEVQLFQIWQLLGDLDFAAHLSRPPEGHVLPLPLLREMHEEGLVGLKEVPFEKRLLTCNICLSEHKGRGMEVLLNCGHHYCKPCLTSYFEAQVADNKAPQMACPEPSCSEQVHFENVGRLLTQAQFESYSQQIFVQAIRARKDAVTCPRPRCGAMISVAKLFKGPRGAHVPQESVAGQCSECNYRFCLVCFTAFHEGQECPINIEKVWESMDEKTMNLIKRVGKYCPCCNILIEKNGGCDHMYCAHCGTHFSWSEAIVAAEFPVILNALPVASMFVPRPSAAEHHRPQPPRPTRSRGPAQDHPRPRPQRPAEPAVEMSRPCPKCRLVRSKTHFGGDHIYCLGCQTGFCFFCGSRVSGLHMVAGKCSKRGDPSSPKRAA